MNHKAFACTMMFVLLGTPVLAQATRQQDVRAKSMHVMPFSMDATMHVFKTTSTGGVMTVRVHDGDARQVALVRSHLRKEAAAFAHGDYSDPMAIHGATMPGIDGLRKARGRIAISYAEIPSGARITFVSADAQVVAAVHRWFAAQVSDHGHDAMMQRM